jgi:hypothetical protein
MKELPDDIPVSLKQSVNSSDGIMNRQWVRHRHQPWYSLRCRHDADTPFDDVWNNDGIDRLQFPGHPAILLVTRKCLVCGRLLLEGRDQTGESYGILYVLKKHKYFPMPRLASTPDQDVREFYYKSWEFRVQTLDTFNKLAIPVAVGSAVLFDHLYVFWAFLISCGVMVALYTATYLAQVDIERQYYRDVGRKMSPTYTSVFDWASKILQILFIITLVIVLG